MASFIPGSSCEPVSQVELTISCRQLKDMDFFSKSDPMCVTFLKNDETGRWNEIRRTETIYNNLNPDFATKVVMDYHFEEQQNLKFEVYDIDNESHSLSCHDFIGCCEVTLGQIVSNGKLSLPLKGREHNVHKHGRGTIIISAEDLSLSRDELSLKFSAKELTKKGWFGWCGPFLEVYKLNEDRDPILVHRTEYVKRARVMEWKRFSVPIRSLSDEDPNRSIQIVCLEWHRAGYHKRIGYFRVKLDQLKLGPCEQNVFECINPKKALRGGYKNSGIITLEECRVIKVYSFLDYILGGMQVHCTVAIDFTASNGEPRSPDSLHYMYSTVPNPYEQALSAVVEIINDYDSDHMFPVLGFGARLPPDGRVSHEFYVNLEADNPYCIGVQGVVEAYKNCLQQIQLYGPTNFSPVIRHVSKFAEAYQDGSQYFILLIITDGVITDMHQTKQAIVNASRLPMSIIIIGVGNADFTAMNELDADTVPLTYGSVTAARDIVQFVPFKDFQYLPNIPRVKARLAKEVLAEIPDQVVGFMKSRGIVPKVPSYNDNEPPPYSEN